jgi:hypothetical protein
MNTARRRMRAHDISFPAGASGSRLASRFLVFTASLLLPGLIVLGCCHCKDNAATQIPFSIELSSGGGFSGRWTGYILHSDGSVQYREGRQTQTENVKSVGTVEPDAILEIKALIDKNGLMKKQYHETGNMTMMLRIVRDDEMQFITWPGAFEEGTQAPGDVQPIIEKLLKLLEQFRK